MAAATPDSGALSFYTAKAFGPVAGVTVGGSVAPGVQSPGLANFTGDGFAPSGFAGIATALFVVAFAFGGTEIVSVVAAENTVVLELAFPEMVLPVLLNIVVSTCLLVWTSALLAQLALRLRADREGTELPLRMPGFPWLTVFGLVILAAIFTVGFIGEDFRPQLLSTFGLVALLAVANWLHHRSGKVAPVVVSDDGAKQRVLVE